VSTATAVATTYSLVFRAKTKRVPLVRRMNDTAEFLVGNVLPRAPYRQWVMSPPNWVRLRLALDAELASRVRALGLQEDMSEGAALPLAGRRYRGRRHANRPGRARLFEPVVPNRHRHCARALLTR
jgi:hypothetical protein